MCVGGVPAVLQVCRVRHYTTHRSFFRQKLQSALTPCPTLESFLPNFLFFCLFLCSSFTATVTSTFIFLLRLWFNFDCTAGNILTQFLYHKFLFTVTSDCCSQQPLLVTVWLKIPNSTFQSTPYKHNYAYGEQVISQPFRM